MGEKVYQAILDVLIVEAAADEDVGEWWKSHGWDSSRSVVGRVVTG